MIPHERGVRKRQVKKELCGGDRSIGAGIPLDLPAPPDRIAFRPGSVLNALFGSASETAGRTAAEEEGKAWVRPASAAVVVALCAAPSFAGLQ
jgi:hypothetical protein